MADFDNNMKKYGFSFILFWGTLLFLTPQEPIPGPAITSQAAVLLDAATGTLLFDKNGDQIIPPASLAKLMTMHIALKEVAEGKAELNEVINLPRESWANNQPPRSSLMYLGAGHIVTLRELLLGLAIPSGNDAAVAVGLRFAASIDAFAERMNQEARDLGLRMTQFVEPSGVSEYNLTTAKEFAWFCREYITLHPETLREYHSVRDFEYPKAENLPPRTRLNTAIRHNSNSLLGTFDGADGLKTGYIDESGYNIALTAERNDTRFVAVILGGPNTRTRDDDGRKLLDWGFEHFKTLRPAPAPVPPRRVWKGKTDTVGAAGDEIMPFTVRIERGNNLRWETEDLTDPLIAPLAAGAQIGDFVLYDDTGELQRFPLRTLFEVEQGGFFKRLFDGIRLFFRSLKSKNS
ncbi:MAG: D-alanyl-D-alanine carboxypeptidase [Spirochaetaceae bacterium]|jgi:D-alanyl-D-alanine carboxypeptidase (penicillin-binding protein 5/6)|nr:D-alanyl-D-alanine carboxypeptidase [Spirochaetaceae bacterium]